MRKILKENTNWPHLIITLFTSIICAYLFFEGLFYLEFYFDLFHYQLPRILFAFFSLTLTLTLSIFVLQKLKKKRKEANHLSKAKSFLISSGALSILYLVFAIKLFSNTITFLQHPQSSIDLEVTLTTELLDSLEHSISVKTIENASDFKQVVQLSKAIIYLKCNMSEIEWASRFMIFNSLANMDSESIPIFKVDCSDKIPYYVESWLLHQITTAPSFEYGVYGTTLLLEKGIMIDYIKNPGATGYRTQTIIKEWLNQ